MPQCFWGSWFGVGKRVWPVKNIFFVISNSVLGHLWVRLTQKNVETAVKWMVKCIYRFYLLFLQLPEWIFKNLCDLNNSDLSVFLKVLPWEEVWSQPNRWWPWKNGRVKQLPRECVRVTAVLGPTRQGLWTILQPMSTWLQCRHSAWWRRQLTTTLGIRPGPQQMTLSTSPVTLPCHSFIIHQTLPLPPLPRLRR